MEGGKSSGLLRIPLAWSGRRPDPNQFSKLLVLAIVLVAISGWSLSGDVGAGGRSLGLTSGDSGLTVVTSSQVDVLPAIAQIVNFTITGNTSGDSGPFDSAPADTLVVFVELFGKTTVNNITIEDGPNDAFVQEAYLLDYVNGGTHGFSVWACTNVSGGPNTDVNVTLTGGTTNSAAIEVVDINGGNPYGGNPVPFVDQVADIIHGNSASPSEGLTVHSNDLALAGIGTWSWNNVTTGGVNQFGDQVTTNSSVQGTNVTAAVLYYSNANSTAEYVVMNGTLSTRAPWIEDIITLGATFDPTTFPVTFAETGLAAGTTWCQNVTGYGSYTVSCRTAPQGSVFDLPSGTYLWNVSYVGNASYEISPGTDGYVSVSGAGLDVDLNFTDPGGHPIQHVVEILLENEPVSAVAEYGTYFEKWYATHYPSAAESALGYDAQCHPSNPEYLALISAETNHCTGAKVGGLAVGDAYHVYNNATLANLLDTATNSGFGRGNFSWANYAENLPSDACTNAANYDRGGNNSAGQKVNNEVGLFATKHTPILFQSYVVSTKGYCESHILPFESLSGTQYSQGQSFVQALAANQFRNFSFISPNLCDDGHSKCGGLSGTVVVPSAVCSSVGCTGAPSAEQGIRYQADRWLSEFIAPILNGTGNYSRAHLGAATYSVERNELNHTVFLITYDEGVGSMGFVPYGGPISGNNYAYCKSVGHATYGACGGDVYMVAVSSNASLLSSSTKNYGYKLHGSDYGMLATVEAIFDLTGVDKSPKQSGKYGVCTEDTGGRTNPGCYDASWINGLHGKKRNMTDFYPLFGLFSLQIKTGANGY